MIRSFEAARDHRLGASIAEAPAAQHDVAGWVTTLLAETKPKALVSAERLGPASDGLPHGATGIAIDVPGIIDTSALVAAAKAAGIPTIGIGDHGNELGFGTIYDAVVETMPLRSAAKR